MRLTPGHVQPRPDVLRFDGCPTGFRMPNEKINPLATRDPFGAHSARGFLLRVKSTVVVVVQVQKRSERFQELLRGESSVKRNLECLAHAFQEFITLGPLGDW